jgi:hypothetical protein
MERFLFETLIWISFEKVKKATSDIVIVVVSVRIRSWISLKQDGIQHFESVSSISILLLLLLLLLLTLLLVLLFRRRFYWYFSRFLRSQFNSLLFLIVALLQFIPS